VKTVPLAFIPPCIPKSAKSPPVGDGWIHEVTVDGWRIQIVKDRDRVALYTSDRNVCSHCFPALTKAFGAIAAKSCIIDGVLVACEPGRVIHIAVLHHALGSAREESIGVVGFDLLHLNGHDVRSLPLIERKLLLKMLTAKAAVANLVFVDGYADGGALIDAAGQLGLEGVVSKRRDAPYRSGRRGEWVKTKCATWLEANSDRGRRRAKSERV
jgi:bifunctional non-homologous end joining protein LigD